MTTILRPALGTSRPSHCPDMRLSLIELLAIFKMSHNWPTTTNRELGNDERQP